MSSPASASPLSLHRALWLVLSLSLAAAVSLGITRFAYGLLLPPMRQDLGWSYTLAGAMNTANALGYLIGALWGPRLIRQWGADRVLLAGAVGAALFMAASGFFEAVAPLMVLRLLAGMVSAWMFVTGGLLAARLSLAVPGRGGLLLGLYYGGTGWGIVCSALLVPALIQWGPSSHAWTWAWWGLAGVCVVCAGVLWRGRRDWWQERLVAAPPVDASAATDIPVGFYVRRLLPALLGYSLFGVGYIGYMTFVIALLRDAGASTSAITVFYTLLGLAVVASSRVWAHWLERYRDGRVLARLNALLALATLMPALTVAWPVVLVSGVMFGGIFLSVVASTTALVRHNLPTPLWASGIAAFTTVFAVGQIAGPTLVGWISDSTGGLSQGLLLSAAALGLGAVLAWRQPALSA